MDKEKLTQEQIDNLISGIINGDPEKVIEQKDCTKCICRYCKRIIRFKVEGGNKDIKLLTYSGCEKNNTGHFYMSEICLKRLKQKERK